MNQNGRCTKYSIIGQEELVDDQLTAVNRVIYMAVFRELEWRRSLVFELLYSIRLLRSRIEGRHLPAAEMTFGQFNSDRREYVTEYLSFYAYLESSFAKHEVGPVQGFAMTKAWGTKTVRQRVG